MSGSSSTTSARFMSHSIPGRACGYPVRLGYPGMSGNEQTYFQKGFNLKAVVRPVLAQSYHSQVVERLKELGYAAQAGEVKIKLAREFGFCYGVDRAVEYAYEAREQFPDRRIFLSGEIIHNPEVNGRIEGLGIRILPDHKQPRRALRRRRQGRRGDPAGVRRLGGRARSTCAPRAACSSTRPAAACSTSGRTCTATRATASPP